MSIIDYYGSIFILFYYYYLFLEKFIFVANNFVDSLGCILSDVLITI